MNELFNLNEICKLIRRMRSSFDSHDFIRIFAMCFPDDYRNCIMHYADIHNAHTQIGCYLGNNASELGIRKIGKRKSLNVYNIETEVSLWEKIE